MCDGSGYTKEGKCKVCNGKGEIKTQNILYIKKELNIKNERNKKFN